MKKIVAILFVVALAFTTISGCNKPANPQADAPQATTGQQTADFWNKWIQGLVIPAAGITAAAMFPGAAPLVLDAMNLEAQLNQAVGANDPTKVQNLNGQIFNVVNDINRLMPK